MRLSSLFMFLSQEDSVLSGGGGGGGGGGSGRENMGGGSEENSHSSIIMVHVISNHVNSPPISCLGGYCIASGIAKLSTHFEGELAYARTLRTIDVSQKC
jgi:hypothetical protein